MKKTRLKMLIREKGMFQQYVAGQIGIDKWRMSKIVNGHIHPTNEEIGKISNFFNEKPEKIFT